MARRRESEGLPLLPQGLTMRMVADALSERLGVEVTPQQVTHVVRSGKAGVRLGRRRVQRTQTVDAIAVEPEALDAIAEAVRALGR